MNCYKHPETAAVAFCRTCGRPLCQACQYPVQGTIVCEEHAPQQVMQPPVVAATSPTATSPGLAFILGLIPGVGAIYNGQYAKGIVHVVIFGLLISILSTPTSEQTEPLFPLLLAAWCCYMPFEAYHTAKKRQLGLPTDEFSSIFPLRAPQTGFPIGPVLLILVGVLFLMNTMGLLHFEEIVRWWPIALIAIGAYMLYCRITAANSQAMHREEAPNEQHQ